MYRETLPASEYAALSAWIDSFYPFQREWLLEPARFAAMVKSRQTGNSLTTAAAVVLWAAFLGETSTVISIGEREAFEVLEKSQTHAEILSQLGSKFAHAVKRGGELRFPASGGRVIALPTSSGGRSFTGNVFLDEYAYVEHPEKVWDAAAGSAMHGYRMRVGSTPNGTGNDFHKLITDKSANRGWSIHRFPIQRALDEGMPVNVADCWTMAKGDERIFRQLFECEFLDGALQYIPTPLIDACCVEDCYCYDGTNYGGIDIGRTHDLTVLYVVREDSLGIKWFQAVERIKRTSHDDLDALVDSAFTKYGCARVAIDSTGLGSFPTERFQQHYGEQRVVAVPFTQQSKEELATSLYQHFADREIRILATDEPLRNDIAALRRIVTAAGNVTYDGPRTDAGHIDNAWALALAIAACGGAPNVRTEIQT